MTKLDRNGLKWKIVNMGAYQFPRIKDASVDLFWNSASLQEMEPDVVENDLRYVDASCRHVYLRELFKGHGKAWLSGQHGVLEQTGFKNYMNELKRHKLVEVNIAPWMWWSRGLLQNHFDAFWTV